MRYQPIKYADDIRSCGILLGSRLHVLSRCFQRL